MRCNRSISKSLFTMLFSCFLFSILLTSVFTPPAHAAFGDFLYAWGGEYNFGSSLGVATDSNGNIYSLNGYSVYVFTNTGTFLRKWGEYGSLDGQFYYAYGIAIDSNDNVYVADAGNQRVQVFSSTGVFLRKWGSSGSGDGQFYNSPTGIAVDGSGNVYVADTNNNRVQVFSNSGTFLRKWGTYGSADGQLTYPRGIAVDSSGNVYVTDVGNCKVHVFSNTGTFLRKLGSSGSGDGQISCPYGIAVDGSGKVYVADTYNSRVQVFSNSGAFLRKWGTYGSGDGQFITPQGIAVDSNGNVSVADTGNNRVQVFSNVGTFSRKMGRSDSGEGMFNYPLGIATDSSGKVYVADTVIGRIQVFSSDGLFLNKWGSSGSGDGQFSGSFGITVDSSGNVYVADSGNNRVQVFDNQGIFIRKWGTYGSEDGQFRYPMGIAIDPSGNVYVTDYQNNRVQVFSSTGTFLRKWGSYGSDDGQFGSPRGIAVDSSGNIYVAEISNFRVQVFSSAGQFIRKWDSPGFAIAVSSSGHVYTASDNNTVYAYSNTGSYLGQFGSWGQGEGQFRWPIGIAVDSLEHLYVLDYGNFRVQVFEGYSTADALAPVTTYTISGSPGNNEWYISDVGVSLTATDADSGVKEIHYSIDGAETVVAGSSASFTINVDGEHSVGYYAVDNAGNIEAAHPLTVKIDKTAPAVTALSSPAPNAAGWNNTSVTVAFVCSDAISGIESCQAPVKVASEGAGQVISGTAKDFAGLTASAAATVHIDKTPPVTHAALGGTLGASCYSTDVIVTLTASDNLSGVTATSYRVNSGPWQTYAGAVVLSAQGAYVITYLSADLAGNSETERTVSFTIDKTAPEAVIRFDAAAKDIKVFNSETGAEESYVVLQHRNDREDGEDDDDADKDGEHHDKDGDHRRELRQYTLVDCANNALILKIMYKNAGREVKVRIVSMQYSNAPVIDTVENKIQAEFAVAKDGTIKALEQKVKAKRQFEVEAKYNARQNETRIKVEVQGEQETKETRTGMTIFEVLTEKGSLTYRY